MTTMMHVVTGFAVLLSGSLAHAQAETCSKFTFAVSESRLKSVPITILKTYKSPVMGIAGKTYFYDPSGGCMRQMGDTNRECPASLPIMSGGKLVARMEGYPMPALFMVDGSGKRDRNEPYYRWTVQRDSFRQSQPRFWLESVDPKGAVIGRFEALDGMSPTEMNNPGIKKQHLPDSMFGNLRGNHYLMTNCRKIAKMPILQERTRRSDPASPSAPRVASRRVASVEMETDSEPLPQLPRNLFLKPRKK